MRRVLLLGVLFFSALATAQDFVRVEQTTPFSTTAPVFVPMSGMSLSFDANPGELVFLLWKAHLSNSAGGTASTELLLADDAGTRWGLGSSSGRAANDTQLWSNFDWEIGRNTTINAWVRAVDGGTAAVNDFEAVAFRLGASSQFPLDERIGVLPIDDAQWSSLVSVTVPSTATTTKWLCFAQANVERTQPTGVSLRIRVGSSEFPAQAVPTDPRSRFLSSGATPRMFFFAAPLTLQPSDVVTFEGTVNPRVAGAGSGATADLRDVRVMLIPSTVLEQQDEVLPPTGFSAAVATQAVAAQLPTTSSTAGWELLTMSVVVTGDGGTLDHELITETGTPPFVSRDVVSVSPGVEHAMLGTWVMRPVSGGTQAQPQWWTRSLTGGIQGWGARAARWAIDGGSVVMPVDSGTPDAGAPDAGVLDAGFDAGVEVDAGVSEEEVDAGPGPERRLGVGCSCSSSMSTLLVLLTAWSRKRRRNEPRGRSGPGCASHGAIVTAIPVGS